MNPIVSVEEGIDQIDTFQGAPEEFLLLVTDSLLDATGFNMAIPTDHILARDLQPDGFEQREGYRLYQYKSWE